MVRYDIVVKITPRLLHARAFRALFLNGNKSSELSVDAVRIDIGLVPMIRALISNIILLFIITSIKLWFIVIIVIFVQNLSSKGLRQIFRVI